jgi:hypothetical protein
LQLGEEVGVGEAVVPAVRDLLLDVLAVGQARQADDVRQRRGLEISQEGGYPGGVLGSALALVAEDGDGPAGQRRPVRQPGRLRPMRAGGGGDETQRRGEVGAFLAFEEGDDGLRRRGEDGREVVERPIRRSSPISPSSWSRRSRRRSNPFPRG